MNILGSILGVTLSFLIDIEGPVTLISHYLWINLPTIKIKTATKNQSK